LNVTFSWIADGRRALPPGRNTGKKIVRDPAKPVHLAVPAWEQELEHFGRQVLDSGLLRVRVERIWLTVCFDQIGSGEAQVSGGSDETGADVSE
jgi:hypothetical protein